jgi:predicted Zn-dependent protease
MKKIILALFLVFASANANAFTVIRDSEIEFIIRELTTPVYKVAGLDASSIKVYVLQSDDLNAFVMGGQNIFITTGLLTYSENPEVMIGVVAHEVGHIVGGHLISSKEEMQNLRKKMLLGVLFGAAAGVATGSTDVGVGSAIGASNAPISSFMKFSRTQESAADNAGIKYLTQLGISPDGLIKFLGDLGKNERSFYDKSNAYMSTHPISQDRIDNIKSYTEKNLPKKTSYLGDYARSRYTRIVAKIFAYTHSPEAVFQKYTGNDTNSNYAKAIAYMKSANLAKTVEYIDKLMDKEPLSPFYLELKGQVYFESGKVAESIPFYEKAYAYAPRENLIKLEYASAMISAKIEVSKAIGLLEQIIEEDKQDSNVWQQLAIAYGQKNDKVNSNIALGWVSLLRGDVPAAKRMAALAAKDISDKSSASLRNKLADLKIAIEGIEFEEANAG